MIQWFRRWWRTRKMARATWREQVLEGRLRAAKEDAAITRGHYERLQADFAVLFDDHLTLQKLYSDLQFARCEDARLGRFQPEAAQA